MADKEQTIETQIEAQIEEQAEVQIEVQKEEQIEIDFGSFGLQPEILGSLQVLHYENPTPIQVKAIPPILEGRNVVGKSQTGSGKTAAFGIPLCNKLEWNGFLPQALILEPTRELAVQVSEELFEIGRMKRLKTACVLGGMAVDKQALTLKQRCHMVTGTPGRVLDHIGKGNLKLDDISYIVIDEADHMLDMGFLEDVSYIIKECIQAHNMSASKRTDDIQFLLFSATFEERIEELITEFIKDPVRITVESEHETADKVEQWAYCVEKEHKFEDFLHVLMTQNPKEAMIFCETREMVNTLYQKMKRKNIRVVMLHGGMEQKDRLYAISDYRKGVYPFLITTDVAARGIDFPDVTHVFNYDFPTNKTNYVHRIGRTGRNGKEGIAISFVCEDEQHYKKAVEQFIGINISEKPLPGHDEVHFGQVAFTKSQKEIAVIKKQRGADFAKVITKLCIGGGKKSKIRPGDVVGAVCAIQGITQEDVGIIDVRDSITYVEILNGKGQTVLEQLQVKPIKGKLRKVSICKK